MPKITPADRCRLAHYQHQLVLALAAKRAATFDAALGQERR